MLNRLLWLTVLLLLLLVPGLSIWNAVMVACDRRLLFDYIRYSRASEFCWATQPMQNANCRFIQAMTPWMNHSRTCDDHTPDKKPGGPQERYWTEKEQGK